MSIGERALGPEGKRILFFYPGTGIGVLYPEFRGCTQELCDLSRKMKSLSDCGYRVAAVSHQPSEVQAEFSASQSLGVPLLSDPSFLLESLFGAATTMTPAGEKVYLRQTMVFDTAFSPRKTYFVSDVESHVADVLAFVRALESAR